MCKLGLWHWCAFHCSYDLLPGHELRSKKYLFCLQVVKENVKSVLGLENSLLDYTDRSLQNLLSEMKNIRETLDQLQKREKILHSDIRSIKAKLEGSSG